MCRKHFPVPSRPVVLAALSRVHYGCNRTDRYFGCLSKVLDHRVRHCCRAGAACLPNCVGQRHVTYRLNLFRRCRHELRPVNGAGENLRPEVSPGRKDEAGACLTACAGFTSITRAPHFNSSNGWKWLFVKGFSALRDAGRAPNHQMCPGSHMLVP